MLNLEHVYIIAELSGNHNGSLDIALRSIDAAKEAGADAVKLQTYTADTMTIDCRKKDFLLEGDSLWAGKSLYELYQWAHTPWEWHETLFAHAKKIGIDIFSSPFDKSAVDFLESLEPVAYKIASFEITDYELVRYAASKGRPMILSTGIATDEEIEEAVRICREAGNDAIALLHCTSSYPTPLEEANLKKIPHLAETYGVTAGLSDHTQGFLAPVIAVAQGARIIEKHFILDSSIPGPDAAFSLDKGAFAKMVQAVRDAEKMLEGDEKRIEAKKAANRRFARSLYIVKDVKRGETVSVQNVRAIRPGLGLHPKFLRDAIGKRFTKDFERGTPLSWDCLA